MNGLALPAASGLNRFLLGSTAERALAAARCPVLTVRRDPGE